MRSAIMWLFLFGLYLAFAGSVDVQEIAAGVVVGVIVLVFARRMVGRDRAPLPQAAWVVPFLRIPWQVIQESWHLLMALLRRLAGREYMSGTFVERPIAPPHDDRGTLRVAAAVFGVCITPNDYIVSIDRKRGIARIRVLVGTDVSPADEALLELR